MNDHAIEEQRQRIIEKCNSDMDKFLGTRWNDIEYNGKKLIPIPSWFLEDLGKCLMAVPAMDAKVHMNVISEIFSKKDVDFTFGEITAALNVFNGAPGSIFAKDVKEYIQKRSLLDMLTFSQNGRMAEEDNELKKKAQMMQGLIKPNGRIIPGSKFHA